MFEVIVPSLFEVKKYAVHIINIERLKNGGVKYANDYRLLRNHGVSVDGCHQKIWFSLFYLLTAIITYYVSLDELYDVLHKYNLLTKEVSLF